MPFIILSILKEPFIKAHINLYRDTPLKSYDNVETRCMADGAPNTIEKESCYSRRWKDYVRATRNICIC